jgi:dimethylargininase
VTHVERLPVDVELAREQWAAYVETLVRENFRVIEVDPAEECPDSVFIEDMLVVHDGLAVVTRPGAGSRRPELAAAEAAIRELGFPVAHIDAPETLDGGDVLIAGGTVYVGTGARTSAGAAAQLRVLLDAPVVEIPIAGILHLKSAVTALPDGTLVGFAPIVPTAVAEFRPVPEPTGGQVVILDANRVLVAADCPRTAELYSDLGHEPVVVDIGEFQKLEGCVTCLSVLVP